MSQMQSEPPTSRLKLDPEFDRLGNLPSDVTEKILSNLSLKEAVRTSILSSKWRYQWVMLPDLVFDELSFPRVLYNHEELVKIIDHVLILHIGPIRKFKLSHDHLEGTADIDKWILHLSRNSVKELSFEFWKRPEYRMPSCLFSCQDLVRLDLTRCLLKPPCTFRGFKRLKKLGIEKVTLTEDDFENLIACCPVLEKLTMVNCSGLTKVKIDVPNLRFLVFRGTFEVFSLQNTRKLQCIGLLGSGDQSRHVPGSFSNLVRIFSQFCRARGVGIGKYFIKYLAVGDLPVKLPKPCRHLWLLRIVINFSDPKEVSATLCLLRSAPTLQRLHLWVRQEGPAVVEEYSWLDENQNFKLRKLRTVEARHITCTKAGLDFIKYLLLNSPILEKVLVKPASCKCSSELSKTLNQFRRSSAHAEIIFLDP